MSPRAAEPNFAGLVLVLLAGGRGTRFGGAKLIAPLAGQPLALHAAAMLAALPFAQRIAVTSADVPDLAALEYTCIALDPPGAPQARSVALGVAAAQVAGARSVLLALADMPLVPVDHIHALVAQFDGDRVGTSADGITMPPAIFGAAHFEALTALSGDRGGAMLLAGAPMVALDPDLALDIDRPEDLARAEALLAAWAT
ncbi:MAG: NTP transferase domain-containing protein [Novosphingobium sp.]